MLITQWWPLTHCASAVQLRLGSREQKEPTFARNVHSVSVVPLHAAISPLIVAPAWIVLSCDWPVHPLSRSLPGRATNDTVPTTGPQRQSVPQLPGHAASLPPFSHCSLPSMTPLPQNGAQVQSTSHVPAHSPVDVVSHCSPGSMLASPQNGPQ